MPLERITILGSGGMGTALAALLARGGAEVTLWGRDTGLIRQIATSRENLKHLPGIPIPASVRVTTDPAEATSAADLIIIAIPSKYLRATLTQLVPAVPNSTPLVSVVKGIEIDTFARPSQVIREVLGERSVAMLSGPSHAEEFARGLPTTVVVAGDDPALNRAVQARFGQGRFRVYTNEDLIGVEWAGALKNIMGIAAGICEGLGFGDNARASLLTRGLAEMARFAVAQGACADTFYGLAGVGDLITTCISPFGRNRAVGLRVGRGETLDAIQATMNDVAEGVLTTRAVHGLATRQGIDMPITFQVHSILFDKKPPLDALSDLMLRPPKEEGN